MLSLGLLTFLTSVLALIEPIGSEGRDVMPGSDGGSTGPVTGQGVPDPAWEVREGFLEEVTFMSRQRTSVH